MNTKPLTLTEVSKLIKERYHMEIHKNTVMLQGHGAVGLVQFGSTVVVWGNNGEKENTGPNWELVLFRPYSKQRFHFKTRRGITKRAKDWISRLSKSDRR